MKQKRSKMARREAIEGYLCIAPWLFGFLCFTFGAMIFSFYISLTKWDLISPAKFVGFSNYHTILTDDFRFAKAIQVTGIYASVGLPLGIASALAIALLLNMNMKGMRLFRSIFYIPAILPGAATTMVWLWMFKPQGGVINTVLMEVGKLYTATWHGVFLAAVIISVLVGIELFVFYTVTGRLSSIRLRALAGIGAGAIAYLVLFRPGYSLLGWPASRRLRR